MRRGFLKFQKMKLIVTRQKDVIFRGAIGVLHL